MEAACFDIVWLQGFYFLLDYDGYVGCGCILGPAAAVFFVG